MSLTKVNKGLLDAGNKANIALDNLTQAGTNVIAHYVMPSNRSVSLSIPSTNGQQFTAPADGFYSIMFYGANAFVALNNNTVSLQSAATTTFNSSVNAVSLYIPVRKNDTLAAWWGGTSITISAFRFFYAEGAY